MGAGIDLSEGAIVGRDFRVIRPLAEGGMGAVYVVEQVSTGKQRALKVMHARYASDPRSRERFELEARASARVASDHVVEVVAAGVDEATNTPWLVMEFLDGETLDAVIARRGALPRDEVREVFTQLGHALAAAHAVGIVHRDLKPENVVLAAPRRPGVAFTVKVLDFGIAKLLTEGAGSNTQAIGSPHWMAPEQTVTGAAIAPPTDVWALGLIAYDALAGVEYWRAAQDEATNPMAIFVEVGAAPIVAASERAAEQGRARLLPPGFDAWFARCVVREMTARYADAAEATAALLALLAAPAPERSPIAFAPTDAVPVFTPTAALPPTDAPSVPLPRTADMPVVPVAMARADDRPPSVATAGWGSPATTAPSMVPPAALAGPRAAPAVARRRPRGWRWVFVGALGAVLAVGGAWAAIDYYSAGPEGPAAERPVAPVADMPFARLQRWEGSYTCASERTPLVLRINGVTGAQVDAHFEFVTAAGVTGVVRMGGAYAPATRRLVLTPGEWVRQPPGYEAVAMDGTVGPDDESYVGRMVHPRCEGFALRLVDE